MPSVIEIMNRAYADEIETVANYLALSVALDGVRAEEIKESLADDVEEELGHARSLAQRIKELGHVPPGSLKLDSHQDYLQPPTDTTDVQSVVRGVLQAEDEAVNVYRSLIEAAREEDDPVTEDLAIKILADEEKHRTLFKGFMKEYEGQAAQRKSAVTTR